MLALTSQDNSHRLAFPTYVVDMSCITSVTFASCARVSQMADRISVQTSNADKILPVNVRHATYRYYRVGLFSRREQ